jgi:hypothetical protein
MAMIVRILLFAGLGLVASGAGAQISVSSLAEFQAGRAGTDSTWSSTLYQNVHADYAATGTLAGVRLEVFDAWGDRTNPSLHIRYQTAHLSQAFLRLNRGAAALVAGNYFAILGRGLTLRAFDLPGVILESQSFRRRYAPARDLVGGKASWQGDRLELKALVGQPVTGDVPPGVSAGSPPQEIDRRKNWVSGAEAAVRPSRGLTLGGTILNLQPDGQGSSWALSGYTDLDLTSALANLPVSGLYGTLYGEYARRAKDVAPGHGLYLSGNLGGPNLGLSLEYKDYENFALGVNGPPSLIREHSAALLNRSTHVLLAQSEKGYQVEGSYALPWSDGVTANVSGARNQLTDTRSTLFREVYLEYAVERHLPAFSGTLFYDWGKDELEGIRSRHSAGAALEFTLDSEQSVGLDLQAQRGARPFGDPQTFNNAYVALSWKHPTGAGIAVMLDRTTDPLEVDDARTLDRIETDPLNLWSIGLSARVGTRHGVSLFAGRRRGGTACTSGTCYQVLPFRGAEMRISSHF